MAARCADLRRRSAGRRWVWLVAAAPPFTSRRTPSGDRVDGLRAPGGSGEGSGRRVSCALIEAAQSRELVEGNLESGERDGCLNFRRPQDGVAWNTYAEGDSLIPHSFILLSRVL